MTWSILVAALLGMLIGVPTFHKAPGRGAVIVGTINATLWAVFVMLTGIGV